jgi:Domain of unknown function (DUF3536)/Glycosyl hydrolase family 57
VSDPSRGRLAVHAHFYQPLRADPWTGRVPDEPSAAPYRNWNERIDAECYRPNAERGTYGRISWDLGPTLASWLAAEAPASHAGFVAGDRWAGDAATTRVDGPSFGTGMACGYHHTILPLASAADRRTEIRWALRDFELRFGRPAAGFWLPETAVDLATLRILAEEGVRYTILAPWQAAEVQLDTRRPYRVELGGGRSIVVAFYDGALSGSVSFEPSATADADRFARERVATRLAGTPFGDGEPGLIVIATDGELYGHHQQFRDLFLQRLVAPAPSVPDRGFDVVELGAALLAPRAAPLPIARIAERTSWSCHHGVARWSAECGCATDGRWKGPLRAALERLAGGLDAATDRCLAELPGAPDRLAARDAWVDVVAGATTPEDLAGRFLTADAGDTDRRTFTALLDAQRWRLAMFASDGWYWDDPVRQETRHVLRCATRAARTVDAIAGTTLERALVGDLRLFASPGTGRDGAAVLREALADVGQPGPR